MHGRIWRVLAAGSIALLAGLGAAPASASAAAHHPAPAVSAAALRVHLPEHAPARAGAVPDGVGFGGSLAPGVFTAQVFQCPEYFCNQGTDYANNDIAGICTVTDNNGNWHWTFTLDHADNVIGFIPSSEFVSSVPLKPCPAGYYAHAVVDPGITIPVYQCPETFCNKGYDYQNNDLYYYCNATQENHTWGLTLDTADDVVGFVPAPILGVPPNC